GPDQPRPPQLGSVRVSSHSAYETGTDPKPGHCASTNTSKKSQAQKRATEVALFSGSPNSVLVFHLRADQITNGGRAGGRLYVLLGAQFLDCVFFVLDVFRLDGQADDAALAVDADDLGFDFVAFLQHVARVFDAIPADFGRFQ